MGQKRRQDRQERKSDKREDKADAKAQKRADKAAADAAKRADKAAADAAKRADRLAAQAQRQAAGASFGQVATSLSKDAVTGLGAVVDAYTSGGLEGALDRVGMGTEPDSVTKARPEEEPAGLLDQISGAVQANPVPAGLGAVGLLYGLGKLAGVL